MKHLQNNFTTPEQSKRLLELGLPADSADLYYFLHSPTFTPYGTPCVVHEGVNFESKDIFIDFPCWSVGRLIEIITICDTEEEWEPTFEPDDNILEMVFDFISENHNNRLDFSKLED